MMSVERQTIANWQAVTAGLAVFSIVLVLIIYYLLSNMNDLARRAMPPGMSAEVIVLSEKCKMYHISVVGNSRPAFMPVCHSGEF